METKYVFITGGVISGLGKGITAASLGRLLKNRGYKVAAQKLDPYLNIDPGTMSPYQHGEVFVTEDGAEADLDLGHYERFIDENLNRFSNLTTGKVYWTLLNKERRGDYLGSTVQVIPHVTDEIKTFLYAVGRAAGADVVITEVGGTVGDIESQPFLEAIRQVAAEVGPRNRVFLHVTPLFYVPRSGEVKTKPTQHSVKELQSAGIAPDLIILRSDGPVEEAVREKIALFCNVKKDCVIPNRSVEELYEAPVMLEAAHLSQIVCRELDLDPRILDMGEWEAMLARIRARRGTVTVALVGKYVRLHDAYLSVAEALAHGGYHNGVAVKIRWLESEDLADEAAAEQALAGADGILVPGGFGSRGVEGKILAARYARTHKVPYLGICLGMQLLFEESHEFGTWKGLGLIPGKVVPMEGVIPADYKIPHIGWNALHFPGGVRHPLLASVEEGDCVYFVHSYYATDCADAVIATTEYGTELTAAVARGNVMGCQFHPEKSGDVGLAILKTFCEGSW